jgi:hypothetical protein
MISGLLPATTVHEPGLGTTARHYGLSLSWWEFAEAGVVEYCQAIGRQQLLSAGYLQPGAYSQAHFNCMRKLQRVAAGPADIGSGLVGWHCSCSDALLVTDVAAASARCARPVDSC